MLGVTTNYIDIHITKYKLLIYLHIARTANMPIRGGGDKNIR